MASEKTKTRIVETARELFNKEGFKGVTMDDIANSLHISSNMISGSSDSTTCTATPASAAVCMHSV